MKFLVPMLLALPLGACSTMNHQTPLEADQREQIVAAIEAAEAAGNEDEVQRLEAILGQHDTSVAERAVGGVIDAIDPWVPAPLQPFKEVLAAAGALALFKRPRKHLVNGVKAVGRLNLKDAGADVLKAVGMLHSTGASAAAAEEESASTPTA